MNSKRMKKSAVKRIKRILIVLLIAYLGLGIFRLYKNYGYINIYPFTFYAQSDPHGEKLIHFVSTNILGFSKLSNGYGKNIRNAYYGADKIKNADVWSFEVFGEDFARDKNQFYYSGIPFSGLDQKTVKVYGRNFIDKNGAYIFEHERSGIHITHIPRADPETFEFLDHNLGKDKNHVYYKLGVVPDADPETFEVISKGYAKDKNRVYRYLSFGPNYMANLYELAQELEKGLFEYKIPVNENAFFDQVDVKTFEVVDAEHGALAIYLKDKDHVYYLWHGLNILEGADTNTFEVINLNCSKDKDSFFQKLDGEITVIKEPNPESYNPCF